MCGFDTKEPLLRKVYLHGALAKKYGKVFTFDVATAGDAIRALVCNFPNIKKDLYDGAWHVVRGKIKDGLSLEAEQLNTFKLGNAELHIMPYVAGSKQGGALKVILGVALLGFSLFMGLSTPLIGVSGGAAIGGLTYGNLAMFGAAVALAGVSSLLSPDEKAKEDKDSSFALRGPTNVYEQGYPVPLVYGEVITGGVMISGGVDVERIAVGS